MIGRFYLQSDDTYDKIEISLLGYKTKVVILESSVT
jgi:hypothetical protein